MKTPQFNNNQVVKIENKEQFDEIYHCFRSAQMGISLEEYIAKYGYPEFPIYLEHMYSVYMGAIIGMTWEPFNKQYEILSFEDACRY